MKVFLDTNVLLDVFSRRDPFYGSSARVWALVETREVQGFVAAASFPNVFYILRKWSGWDAAYQALTILRDLFQVADLDRATLQQAIDAKLRDFEDAIQYFSALRAGADVLVTRDVHGFPTDSLRIQTPEAFLARHFS